jgi:ABC-type Fe3+-hydroxamate transport system substrate-binding protein
MVRPRVVSLVPSATETLLAWDVTPIAVTKFCEQPDLAHVGGTKDPHVDAIIELHPDLVVMCDQENRKEDYERLCDAGLNVFAFTITHVDHVDPQLAKLSQVLERNHTRADDTAEKVAATARVFVPIWKRPWMTINADTYASSVLASLGLVNVFADAATRYPEVTEADVLTAQPNVVLAPSEPYPFTERHRSLLEQFGQVRFVDGKDLFWWGIRTASARSRLVIQVGQR